jgi:hypothetical protein
MTKEKINQIIEASIDMLFEKDSFLLSRDYDINERTVSHKLAIYLESYFSKFGYDVDVEYNRMRGDYDPDAIGNLMGKRLNWEDSGEDSSFVYPDIIIHKRDSNENLLEIEIKMAWKNGKKTFDYEKIDEYMNQLGYSFGAYIELDENRDDCKVEYGPFNS